MKPVYSGQFIDIFLPDIDAPELKLPYFSEGISAGFPSPALDFKEAGIDLNKLLIKHKSATFFGRTKGDSLKNARIYDTDLLIIDKAEEPLPGRYAIVFIDGEFTAKRIEIENNELWLYPENENYKPIKVGEENNVIIWGIIRTSITNHI